MEGKFLLDPVLERLSLLKRQAVRLRNNGNDIDSLAQLLQHHNIDRLQRVPGGSDEVETAVDACILDVALTLCSKLLAEVCGVLVLDILHNRIPAAVVVHEIAVAGCVNDVESEAHAILFDDVGDRVDLGGASDGLVGVQSALRVDKMAGEDGVDQCALAKSSLA